jgi:hypothetical protein
MTPIVTLNAARIPNLDSDERMPDVPKSMHRRTEHLLESSRIGRLGCGAPFAAWRSRS